MGRLARIRRPSQVLLAMALVLAILGVAGAMLGSFAYPFVLGLALLFGVVGVASVLVRGRGTATLCWVVIALTVVAMYVYLVSGGGPPPPSPTR